MGYVYFYYDTKREVCDYVGITKSISRRTKEHLWYEDWVNDNHIIGYLPIPDKYMCDVEYVFINELKPIRNIQKRQIPEKLKGYSTNWDELLPRIKYYKTKSRVADHFS